MATALVPGVQRKRKPMLITFDKITETEVDWLWYPYIPIGAITTVYGPGGVGKSHITCDIAARISRGDCMPFSDTKRTPMKVLMLSAEDDPSKVLKGRLRHAGAEMKNIAIPERQFILDTDGVRNISEYMREFAATICFIDPIVYYAGGKIDINRSNEVRELVRALDVVAAETNSAIIIVGHSRKSSEGRTQDGMMGSADWINAARSSINVDRSNDGTRIMRHPKANWGPNGTALAFSLGTDCGQGFHWTGFVDEDDIIQSIGPTHGGRPRGSGAMAAKARSFLFQVLANGPVESNELIKLAEDEGIAPATLNRAKPGVATSKYHPSERVHKWHLVTNGNMP